MFPQFKHVLAMAMGDEFDLNNGGVAGTFTFL
jgi:hypothetical protein